MKSTETVEEHSRPLPGPGAFRESVLAVRRVLDEAGKPLRVIALNVEVEGEARWEVLDCLSLINGKIDQLAALFIDIGRGDPIDAPGLKQLGKELLGVAKKRLILLGGEGYREIDFEGTVFQCFVWRDEVLWITGRPALGVIAPVSGRKIPPVARSNVATWNRKIGSKFAGNHYLIVMLGAALSAPLRRVLHFPALSLLFVGESSTGKSAAQSAVQSIFKPGMPLENGSGTALGLQQLLSEATDQPVFLQETRQMGDPEGWIKLLFDIGNDAQRTVGTAAQTALSGKALHCTLIASNERDISELSLGQTVRVDAGLYARVLELYVQGPHGMFHRLPDDMSGAEFADMLVTRSNKYYGAVWNKWIRKSIKHTAEIRRRAKALVPEYREHLIEVAGVKDPVSRRMARSYAYWQFAAVAAQKLGVISLAESEIKAAFEFVLAEHQARRAAGQTPLDERVIEAVRAVLDQNPNAFADLESGGGASVNGLMGYRHRRDGKQYYLFFRKSFVAAVKSFSVRDALRALKKARLLLANTGCDTLSVRMPPGKLQKRFYAVDAAIQFDG